MGPGNQPCPGEACARRQVLPLRILTAKVITKNRAQVADYMFLCKITHDEFTPEYNGFNTDKARTQGYSVKPSTRPN